VLSPLRLAAAAMIGASLSCCAAVIDRAATVAPNGSLLRPYDNAWLFSARDPAGLVHPQGIWSDHVQYVTIDGRRLMERVQGMTYVTGLSLLSINVFDPASMRPVSSVQHRPDGSSISRKFSGTHVETTRVSRTGETPTIDNIDLPAETYDFYGGMWGLLLATMPIAQGQSGSFPSIDEDGDVPRTATYQVLGREWVSAGAHGKIRAWRISADRPEKYRMTFWLTQAPPYVIGLELVNAGDPRVLRFDMI